MYKDMSSSSMGTPQSLPPQGVCPAPSTPFIFHGQQADDRMANTFADWNSTVFGAQPDMNGAGDDGTKFPAGSFDGSGSIQAGENSTHEDKNKGKCSKGSGSRTKKACRPRFAFQTRSANDILDDGYRWRKYGQKAVKNSSHPRSYYRCVHHTCSVKKQIQRMTRDTSIVVTTYEGVHNHPSEQLMETLNPLLKQMQLLSRFYT
ncbi:unnamed protein product [Victoria cruziana]